jgi:hypothetical protein
VRGHHDYKGIQTWHAVLADTISHIIFGGGILTSNALRKLTGMPFYKSRETQL